MALHGCSHHRRKGSVLRISPLLLSVALSPLVILPQLHPNIAHPLFFIACPLPTVPAFILHHNFLLLPCTYRHYTLSGCSPYAPGQSGAHCPGMTDDEYRTEFAIWSITQSPLILATDPRNLTSIMEELLFNQELLSIHQDTTTPPGQLVTECGSLCLVWARPLSTDGTVMMVALVNFGPATQQVKLQFSDLGWNAETTAEVTDLWTGEDSPDDASGALSALVPSHGTGAYKLTVTSDRAGVVAMDREETS